MKRVTISCCSTKTRRGSKEIEMEIPEQIRKELDERGGFGALADRIPLKAELAEKSRIYHALSDPLRLTILYLLRDQPLCVCVIKAYIGIAGSKLILSSQYSKRSRTYRLRPARQLAHLFADRHRTEIYPVIDPFPVQPRIAFVILRITWATLSLSL